MILQVDTTYQKARRNKVLPLKSTDPQRLVEAVVAWLQYEQLCNRIGLLGESYLTYPVGQFLQAKQRSVKIADRQLGQLEVILGQKENL